MANKTKIYVNERPWTVDAAPESPLPYVLSNELQLKGPRFGCGSVLTPVDLAPLRHSGRWAKAGFRHRRSDPNSRRIKCRPKLQSNATPPTATDTYSEIVASSAGAPIK